MSTSKRSAVAWMVAAWLCSLSGIAAAEDTVAAAKELYGTAAYSDALSMLDRLKAAHPSADEAQEIDKYRAFCLFAMGKTGDAESVVVDMLAARPRFRLDEREASPRVVAAFRDVRRRQLPLLVQQAYTRGREAYDGKRTDAAIEQFRLVLDLADDADAPKDQQLVKDMQVLAGGFLSLAEAARAAEVKAKAEAAAPPPPPPPAPVIRQFYSADDADVTPPVVVNQEMPQWPLNVPHLAGKGILEVLIDEKGEVATATMRARIHPIFDALLLEYAKQWRYRPATRGSQPVKYLKRIEVVVQAPF